MTHDRATLLTPEALDTWLAQRNPDQSAGNPLSLRTCPLACYLSARTGYTWRIWGDEAEPAEGPEADQVSDLPEWARWFTAFVDSHPEPTVTVRAARSYLEMAAREKSSPRG